MIREFLDFFDAPAGVSFDLPAEQAIAFFRSKGLKASFGWQDMLAEEHVASFTVAKMMDVDLLADVQTSLQEALATGTDFRAWTTQITPLLQQKGWWGKKEMIDPLTGNPITAQLGSPGRLKTIFRTNLQSAYAVGSWQQIKEQEKDAPFLMYDAIDDYRTRPAHAAWDNRIYPIDSEFWKAHYPPNGWNCRCGVIQLSDGELQDLGLQKSPPFKDRLEEWTNPRTGATQKVPVGVDPSFNINAGQARLEALQKLALEKVQTLPPDLQSVSLEGIKATQNAMRQYLHEEVGQLQGKIDEGLGALGIRREIKKAAERAVGKEIAGHISANTPYLAKALQQVQAIKANAGLPPSKVLELAKVQALKAKETTALANWKTAYLKGGKIPAASQQVFDNLPQAAKDAMLAQMDAKKAAAAIEKAAVIDLQKIAAGDLGSMEQSALAKLKGSDAFDAAPAAKQVAEVKAEVAKQKSAIQNGDAQGFADTLIQGKIPTPAQKDAFYQLSLAQQDEMIEKVVAAKAAAVDAAQAAQEAAQAAQQAIPAPMPLVGTPLNVDDLVQTGGQGGSNPGGEFQDTGTGVKWYLKWPDGDDALRNEALANRLYALAGLDVPETKLVMFRGKLAIASKIIDGLRVDKAALTAGRVQGAQEFFAVDAWLANWDVVGLSYDNLKLLGKKAVRIDPGGALRYRAQGGLKGAAFGNEVTELESLRSGMNQQSQSVFQYVTEADIEDGVRRILLIDEEDMRRVIEDFGPVDENIREVLLKTLLARREDLRKRYPQAVPQPAVPIVRARVTAIEQVQIEASRANGYDLPTDGGDIEDQQVIISTYTDRDGNIKTRVALKLTGKAGTQLESTTIPELAASLSAEDLVAQAGQLFRAINYRIDNNQPVDDKLISRWQKFKDEMLKHRQELKQNQAALGAQYDAHLKQLDDLDAVVAGHDLAGGFDLGSAGLKIVHYDFDKLAGPLDISANQSLGGIAWKKNNEWMYQEAHYTGGRLVEQESKAFTAVSGKLKARGVGTMYEAQVEGATVRYAPGVDNVELSWRNYVQIEIDGVGVRSTESAFNVLEALGINSQRPAEIDRLELYVNKIYAIRRLRNDELRQKWVKIKGTREEQVQARTTLLSEDAGFDITKSKRWDPYGKRQAFDAGRTLTLRPDLSDADVAKLGKLILYQNPVSYAQDAGHKMRETMELILNSGGQMATQTDRIRRGLPIGGSSSDSDIATGGGSFVYSRLRSRRKDKTAGVYYHPSTALRSDAFSYADDEFGNVSEQLQQSARAKSVDELIEYSKKTLNETNFKGSLSFFDNVERWVLPTANDAQLLKSHMQSLGYATFPDGRSLDDVIDYVGSSAKWPP